MKIGRAWRFGDSVPWGRSWRRGGCGVLFLCSLGRLLEPSSNLAAGSSRQQGIAADSCPTKGLDGQRACPSTASGLAPRRPAGLPLDNRLVEGLRRSKHRPKTGPQRPETGLSGAIFRSQTRVPVHDSGSTKGFPGVILPTQEHGCRGDSRAELPGDRARRILRWAAAKADSQRLPNGQSRLDSSGPSGRSSAAAASSRLSIAEILAGWNSRAARPRLER